MYLVRMMALCSDWQAGNDFGYELRRKFARPKTIRFLGLVDGPRLLSGEQMSEEVGRTKFLHFLVSDSEQHAFVKYLRTNTSRMRIHSFKIPDNA